MAEPWTDVKSIMYGGGSYLRTLQATLTAGSETEITSIAASTTDLLEVVNEKPSYVGATSTSKEYIEGNLSSGVKVKLEKTTSTINAQTGYKMSDESDNYEKFEISAWMSYANYKTFLGYYRSGNVLFAMRSIGRKAEDRAVVGDEHILGKITEFDATFGDQFVEVSFTITGGTVYTIKSGSTITATEYNALMTGAGNEIEPVGSEAVTPTAIDATDFTNIFAGNIVQKDAALPI